MGTEPRAGNRGSARSCPDEQWGRIEPHLPTDVRGVERADDRRGISGIVHVLKSGCRWCDCPPEYGPSPKRRPFYRAPSKAKVQRLLFISPSPSAQLYKPADGVSRSRTRACHPASTPKHPSRSKQPRRP